MARIGNRFVQAPSHGGSYRAGQPRLVVAHSLECDAKEGLAWGLVGYAASAGVSPHTATDPGETVGWCDTNLVGWHCGNGNQHSVGAEVTGRAAWTRDTWLSGNPNKALERQAKAMAELGLAIGFGPQDFRWLSLGEVGDGRTKGCCYHYDISRTLGGTNHWDPGTGYPADVQMTRIRWYAGAQNHWGLDPATRPDGVTVIGGGTGVSSGGGADPNQEEDMANVSQAQLDALVKGAGAADWIQRRLGEIPGDLGNLGSTNQTVADIQRRVEHVENMLQQILDKG